MAIDTIKSTAVLDGAIATADIADDAVTNAKIGAGAVGTTEVANDAITGDKVSNTLVIASQLQTPSVAGSADTDTSVSFPGSNIVQMNNAATARHKFHTLNGNSLFEVQASSTGGSGAGGAFLKFKGSNGTPVDIASIDGSMTNGTATSESGILSFFTMNSGTSSEKVRIFSNGAMAVPNGIAIGNGINAAASNLLDDYEEGTWTPNCATPGVSGSYSVQLGRYIKVGNLVQCIFNLTTNGSYTGSTSSVFQLGGLPFANKYYNGSLYAGGNIGYYFNINTVDTCKQIVYQIPSASASAFELKGTGDNQGEISIIVSNFNSNSVIRGQLVYHTA